MFYYSLVFLSVYQCTKLVFNLISLESIEMDRWWQKESLLKFESPTSIFIVGPSNSGKSFLTKKLLIDTNKMFESPPSQIYFYYSVWQELYDQMLQCISNITFHIGLPTMDELKDWGGKNGHKIVVLDDLMLDAADSSEMTHMMCVGNHHYNVTTIHILQNVFQRGKSMRTASLNCYYFILFRSFRDVLQIQTLGTQMFPGKISFFMDAYHKATAQKFTYLLTDLHPLTNKIYQLRTYIFPGEFPKIFHPLQ